MRRFLIVLVCASLVTSGCASAGAPRVQAPSTPDPALLASYTRQLPVGSRVRVGLTDGRVVKGTLMNATDTGIVVQRRTRIPEPPDQFAFATVTSVQIEPTGGPGKAIAIGAAAGAAAALGVFLILAAIFAGD